MTSPSDALEKQAFYARYTSMDYFKKLYNIYKVPPVELWRAFRNMLIVADTYYMSNEALKLLEYCAKDIPGDTVVEPPPTQTGFCWLETPKAITEQVGLSGITWHQNPDGKTVVFAFVKAYDDPRPIPMGLATYAQNETIVDAIARSIGVNERDEPDKRISALAICFFSAFNVFVKQRLLKSSQEHAHRHVQRRLKKENFHINTINVIKLRAVDYTTSNDSAAQASVDWTHRWIVRGHWRKQWYPSQQANHAVFITPYIKGPADKPLVIPEHTVFGVVR